MSSQATSDLEPNSRALGREALAEIVARGRSLSDRFAPPSPALASGHPPAAVAAVGAEGGAGAEALLARWRQLVAEGDDAVFRKRLSWDGLDVDSARLLLGSGGKAEVDVWPEWADTLGDALEVAARLADQMDDEALADDRCLLPGFTQPFQDVALPFVLVARKRLAARVGPAAELVSPEAASTLEHRLLQRVTSLCANALLVEFATRRQRRQSSLSRLVATLQGEPGTEHYVRFTHQMWAGGLTEVFRAYPVLARLCAVVTDLWVDATAEFLLRLDADRRRIHETFHPDVDLGPVVAVGQAVSDSHNEGRSVLAVTFESGLRLIYKPKDVHLEQAYFALLGWFEERGAPLSSRGCGSSTATATDGPSSPRRCPATTPMRRVATTGGPACSSVCCTAWRGTTATTTTSSPTASIRCWSTWRRSCTPSRRPSRTTRPRRCSALAPSRPRCSGRRCCPPDSCRAGW